MRSPAWLVSPSDRCESQNIIVPRSDTQRKTDRTAAAGWWRPGGLVWNRACIFMATPLPLLHLVVVGMMDLDVVICSQSISSHRYRVINDWTVTLCTWWVHSCGIEYSSVPFPLVKVHLSIFNRSFHLPINPRSKIYSSFVVDRQLLSTRSFMAWPRRSKLTISGDGYVLFYYTQNWILAKWRKFYFY